MRDLKYLLFLMVFIGVSASTLMAQAPWWQQTTIYQIYPRSFQDSDGDGIGDVNGIISRLDYLQKLGIETVWVSPFYESPQKDFGYDISDYRTIDLDYGSSEEVDSLIEEVHKRNMKIVFDMVLNHTSNEHDWFVESSKSKDNPKNDWYIWRDGKGKKKAPNNWVNVINQDAWTYVPERDQWVYSAFLDFQPDLNWRNPAVRAEMYSIVKYWLNKGVDGFRLDIFNCLMEDAAGTDNPRTLNPVPSRDGIRAGGQRKKYNINHPDNYVIARELRSVIDSFSNPQRFVVGEVFGGTETIKPYLGKDHNGLNLAFDFDLIFYDFKAEFFRNKIKQYEEEFPAPYMPTLVLGNHDNFRSISRVENDLQKAKLLAAFQLTARGVPVIYYGEEVGMINSIIPKSEALDPISDMFIGVPTFLRKRLPVPLNRDVCRSPMQWEDEAHGAFCPNGTAPWVRMAEEVDLRNVKYQDQDVYSLFSIYSKLFTIRRTEEALQQGSIRLWEPPVVPPNVLAYYRSFEGETLFIALNFSRKKQSIPWAGRPSIKLMGIQVEDGVRDGLVQLSPLGGVILKVDP